MLAAGRSHKTNTTTASNTTTTTVLLLLRGQTLIPLRKYTITHYALRSKPMTVYVGAVPAKIVDSMSSGDVTVQEGASVSLVCHVTGVPRPEVTWRRKQTMSLESSELLATDKYRRDGHSDYSMCELLEGAFAALFVLSDIEQYMQPSSVDLVFRVEKT